MNDLTDIFPVLCDEHITPDDPRHSLLEAPSLLAGNEPISHPAFGQAACELNASVMASPLTWLLGAPGVGKTCVAHAFVQSLNRSLASDGRVPAVSLAAPPAQSASFPWKGLWERLLVALERAFPEHGEWKLPTEARADAPSPPPPVRRRRMTEFEYFEMACSAATSRALAVLVVDEATAFLPAASRVSLRDQVHVLRDFAERTLVRVVLVSSFRILPCLDASAFIDRRLSQVIFPRYADPLCDASRVSGTSSSCPIADCALTFMDRLPPSARFLLGDSHLLELHQGSVGCAGLLHDWYLRAIFMCLVLGEHRLKWDHFKRSALRAEARANLLREALVMERELDSRPGPLS